MSRPALLAAARTWSTPRRISPATERRVSGVPPHVLGRSRRIFLTVILPLAATMAESFSADDPV
jgi:hypothetical protein